MATLAVAAIWGGVGLLIIPLHVQQIEFAHFFQGRDAGVDLQFLMELKTRVAAGLVVPTAEQQRLLGLLAQFDASRASSLSVVTVVGVFMTMLIQPAVGVLSDRTRSTWGRRAPWVLAGGVGSALGLLGFYFAASILALAMLWALVGIATNTVASPLVATVADRSPEEKIGTVSAITGLGTMLGLVVGSAIAGMLFNAIGVASYLPFAFFVLLFCILFVLGARDRSSASMRVEPITFGGYLRSLTIALRTPDFRWVWIAKVLLVFGYTTAAALNIYMLQSYIHPALSAAEAARIAPLILFAALPGTLIAMIVAGRWSDRSGRRKPFVIGSSILFAASMIVPLVWPTLPAMFIQTILAGIAFGSFLIVDQALFIDVLPDRDAAGRDLGIGALGANIGQALGPVLAGLIVSATGDYRLIWVVALLLSVVAAAAIVPVKGTR
jgi:MFS family permease